MNGTDAFRVIGKIVLFVGGAFLLALATDCVASMGTKIRQEVSKTGWDRETIGSTVLAILFVCASVVLGVVFLLAGVLG